MTAAKRSIYCSVTAEVFDLLLTDIRMPGLWTASHLRLRQRATIPSSLFLLMTGYADQRERAHGLDALIHDVISKPFTLAALRKTVEEALDGQSARS